MPSALRRPSSFRPLRPRSPTASRRSASASSMPARRAPRPRPRQWPPLQLPPRQAEPARLPAFPIRGAPLGLRTPRRPSPSSHPCHGSFGFTPTASFSWTGSIVPPHASRCQLQARERGDGASALLEGAALGAAEGSTCPLRATYGAPGGRSAGGSGNERREALLHGLKDYGAGEIFGIPGDFALPFFKVMEESRILPLHTLSHEPAVGFAADAAGTVSRHDRRGGGHLRCRRVQPGQRRVAAPLPRSRRWW